MESMRLPSLLTREYRTVSYVSGPLIFVERVKGVGYGETVEDPSDVKPSLLRALEQVKGGRLALLDVVLKSP